MSDGFAGKDRREFFRYKHEQPLQYKIVGNSKSDRNVAELIDAVSKNLSISGVLFSTRTLPSISSVLLLDLDFRTTRICQEIEDRALMIDDKMVGKVVRIEESADGLYDVGVAFLTKVDKLPREVKVLAK